MRIGVAAAISLFAATAHAEPVRLQVEGDARIQIHDPDRPSVQRTCVGSCTVDLPRRFYRLRVEERPGVYRVDTEIQVAGPTEVSIDQGSKTPRWILKAVGGVWVALGVCVTAYSMTYLGPDPEDPGRSSVREQNIGIAIGGTLLVGGLMAILLSAAYGPSVTTWSLVPTVSKSNAGVAWSVAF